MQNLGIGDSLKEDGSYYIGSGIAPHSGGYEEAIFAINKDLSSVFVIILTEGDNIQSFKSENAGEIPEVLQQWYNERIHIN